MVETAGNEEYDRFYKQKRHNDKTNEKRGTAHWFFSHAQIKVNFMCLWVLCEDLPKNMFFHYIYLYYFFQKGIDKTQFIVYNP